MMQTLLPFVVACFCQSLIICSTPNPNQTWLHLQKMNKLNTERKQLRTKIKVDDRSKYFSQAFAHLLSRDRRRDDVTTDVVTIGFALSSSRRQLVKPKKKISITNFSWAKPGCFMRGNGFDLEKGRFSASVRGVYTFDVHVRISVLKSTYLTYKRRDFATLSICIEDDCDTNISLTAITGLGGNSRIISLSTHGHLQLERGQYVSVFVSNNSGRFSFNVLRDVYFTGMIVGR